jgi:hypothetical protein
MPDKPGLYLSLSHGRDYPQQYMRQRGFAGPKIGPLFYVQTQYAQRITIRFANKRDVKKFFPDALDTRVELEVIEGSMLYGDKCFGCWDACYISAEFCLPNTRKATSEVKRRAPKSQGT